VYNKPHCVTSYADLNVSTLKIVITPLLRVVLTSELVIIY